MQPLPPKFFLKLFRSFAHPSVVDHIEGDLIEVYQQRLASSGKLKADVAFIKEVLLLFRPGIIRRFHVFHSVNQIPMLKNYFKIAWRNIVKNKGYSSINVIGLAVGMAVAMLIGTWIADELSFDSYFQNRDRLAQVLLVHTDKGITHTGPTIASPVEDPLRTNFSNEFKALSLVSYANEKIISVGDKRLVMPGRWVQHDFPDMFTLEMLHGSRLALKDASKLLLSRSLAKALFGDTDPIDKIVKVDNKIDFIVGGVYDDLPQNTTFARTHFLLPWQHPENWNYGVTDWSNHSCLLFVQLADHVQLEQVAEKIKTLPTPHIPNWKEEITLEALERLHLYGNEGINGETRNGHIQFVWLFGTIGAFVLLLACINFMNLSTARSETRAKEVGVRKTVGSVRGQLVGQFLTESIVVVLLAFFLSLVLTQLALPFFNTLAGKQMSMPWAHPYFWLVAVAFALFTGLVSGSYPAFYLSAFKPVKVLKGTFKTSGLALLPRKVLVVLQFTVSVTLIISTVVVFRQIEFAKNRVAGYSRDGLVTVWVNTPELSTHFDVIRNEVMQTGAVDNMARASQSPAHFGNNNSVEWRGKDPNLVIFFNNVSVSPEFGQTVGWTIKAGRDFYTNAPDSTSVIVNEAAIKVMGFEEPIGEVIQFWNKSYTIAGVVENMVTQSPFEPERPALFLPDGWLGVIIMKLNASLPVNEAMARIEPVFKKHNPSGTFAYGFVDQEFDRKFAMEERIGKLAAFFTVLAVFISCLGLFGLAAFVAAQRTKEIGVRKVLGASVGNLWRMLSGEFVRLILVACLIAVPFSSLVMTHWLEHYEYRTTIGWPVLLGSVFGAFIITLLTVSFQAIKASLANPVKSLRSE